MKKFFAFFMVIILSGCVFQTKHRGYVFPSDLNAQMESIKTTAQLQEKIGFPQVKTIYGDEVWIYYGVDENYRGPLAQTYNNQTVLLVWVKNGRVVNTRILHDVDLPNVLVDNGETKIPAAIELNALQELFNNIGRFSPAGLGQ